MLKELSISDQSFEPKMLFWVLIGPLFLIFSLLISSFGSDISNGDLWGVAIVGIALCSVFQRKGFIISLGFLALVSVLKHSRLTSFHAWQLGLELSICIGFVITYVSFEYLSQWISSFAVHTKSLLHQQSLMEEELGREEEFFVRQKKGWQELVDEKETQTQALTEELESLLEENKRLSSLERQAKYTLQQKEEEVSVLKNQMHEELAKEPVDSKELLKKVETLEMNLLTIEKEKNESTQSFEKNLLQKDEDNKDLNVQISSLNNGIEVLKKMNQKTAASITPEERNMEHLYKQLKRQFVEKGEHLHDARKELFQSQEILSAQKIKMKELSYKTHPKEKEFFKKIDTLLTSIEILKEENRNQQSLISNLHEDLAQMSKRIDPPKAGEQLSLFS